MGGAARSALPSKRDERGLACGRARNRIASSNPLRRALPRRSRLLRAAQRGDRRAREQLVASHLGLVRSVAARYRDLGPPVRRSRPGGLARPPRRDRPLRPRAAARRSRATPASAIRRAIRNALTEQARLIRLPKQVVERRQGDRARRGAGSPRRRPAATPTPAELAAATGLSVPRWSRRPLGEPSRRSRSTSPGPASRSPGRIGPGGRGRQVPDDRSMTGRRSSSEFAESPMFEMPRPSRRSTRSSTICSTVPIKAWGDRRASSGVMPKPSAMVS